MAIALFTNARAFAVATYEVQPEAVAAVTEELGAEAGAAFGSLQGEVFESQIEFADAIKFAAAQLPDEARTSLRGKIQDLAKGALELNGLMVLIAICAFIAGFAISLGPVMWAMFSEIFPLRVRGLAISIAGFFNSGISWLVQQVFPIGMDSVGPAIVFGFFGTLSVAAFLFTIFIIPETKGRSLEELEELLVRN